MKILHHKVEFQKQPPPYRFYRDYMTVDEIIEESKFDFTPSVDESKIIQNSRQISMWDAFLDSNNGCIESCEIF